MCICAAQRCELKIFMSSYDGAQWRLLLFSCSTMSSPSEWKSTLFGPRSGTGSSCSTLSNGTPLSLMLASLQYTVRSSMLIAYIFSLTLVLGHLGTDFGRRHCEGMTMATGGQLSFCFWIVA